MNRFARARRIARRTESHSRRRSDARMRQSGPQRSNSFAAVRAAVSSDLKCPTASAIAIDVLRSGACASDAKRASVSLFAERSVPLVWGRVGSCDLLRYRAIRFGSRDASCAVAWQSLCDCRRCCCVAAASVAAPLCVLPVSCQRGMSVVVAFGVPFLFRCARRCPLCQSVRDRLPFRVSGRAAPPFIVLLFCSRCCPLTGSFLRSEAVRL